MAYGKKSLPAISMLCRRGDLNAFPRKEHGRKCAACWQNAGPPSSKPSLEAELLAQLPEREGEDVDPVLEAAQNFPPNFVFSPAEFERLFARQRLLIRAKNQIPMLQGLHRTAA